MRRTRLVMCALVVTSTFGCSQVKKQVAAITAAVRAKFGHSEPPPVIIHHIQRPTPPAPVAVKPPPPPPPVATRVDQPYVSPDTGTLTAGMSEREVYELWGAPVAVRRAGSFTYLFFRNGCEHRCGTEDVVTLENGLVTNAVVRWPGHGFLATAAAPEAAPAAAPAPPAPSVPPADTSAAPAPAPAAAAPPAPPADTTNPVPPAPPPPPPPDTTAKPDSARAPAAAP